MSNRRRRIWRSGYTGVSGICLSALLIAGVPLGVAYGQHMPPIPGKQIFSSRIQPLTDTIERAQGDPRPATAQGAIPMAGWLLYGKLAVGSAYDSNFNSSSTAPISVNGARLMPSGIALRETGVHRTELYGEGDIRYYPSEDFTSAVDTRIGVAHTWRIQRDFIYRMQGQVGFNEDRSSLTSAGAAGTPAEPVRYREDFGSTSLEKGFGRIFVALGGSAARTDFDNIVNTSGKTINENFRDGLRYTIKSRLGYHISPFSYAFVEPSREWLRYSSASEFDSKGNRLVAGVGTGRIRLFNGELYAGQYRQDFDDPTIGSIDGPLYGGRLSWYPTRFITLTGNLEHYFDLSDYRRSPTSVGSITENDTLSLKAYWDFTRSLTLEGSVGFTNEDYIDSPREDEISRYSIGATYYIVENFGITFEYAYWNRSSNVPGGGYSRDFISVGGKTRF